MARISGVDIPREKRLEIALTYIYGIGRATSAKMCKDLELSPDTRVRNLTDSEVNKIRMYIENGLTVEGDLRRNVQTDIKRKIEIGSYQGTRHRKGLPVRGQRTHTNADVFALALTGASSARLRLSHDVLPHCLFLVSNGLLRSLTGTSIGVSALTTNG